MSLKILIHSCWNGSEEVVSKIPCAITAPLKLHCFFQLPARHLCLDTPPCASNFTSHISSSVSKPVPLPSHCCWCFHYKSSLGYWLASTFIHPANPPVPNPIENVFNSLSSSFHLLPYSSSVTVISHLDGCSSLLAHLLASNLPLKSIF